MLIQRSDLRLVFTAGLATGFGAITAMPFHYYLAMTVLAVSTGSYGGVIGLGRQRLLGSVLGSVVLGVTLRGLGALPMPLALALALAALRLLGGLFKLQVGYKVGGMIVVMGWLVHDNQLEEWIHMRLIWTMVGIALSLLSLRLFWPSSAASQSWHQLGDLFDQLAAALELQAEELQRSGPGPVQPRRVHRRRIAELRTRLLGLRALRPQVREELGIQPREHPIDRLLERFETTGSRLIGIVKGLEARPSSGPAMTRQASPLPESEPPLPATEAALLLAVAARLRLWTQGLRRLDGRSQALPVVPQDPFAWPEGWISLESRFQGPELEALPLQSLQQLAGRLVLCRQAQQLVEGTEAHWLECARG